MVLKIQLKKDYTKNKKLEYQMDKALKKTHIFAEQKHWKTNSVILCNVDIRFPTFRISGNSD